MRIHSNFKKSLISKNKPIIQTYLRTKGMILPGANSVHLLSWLPHHRSLEVTWPRAPCRTLKHHLHFPLLLCGHPLQLHDKNAQLLKCQREHVLVTKHRGEQPERTHTSIIRRAPHLPGQSPPTPYHPFRDEEHALS